MKLTTHSDTSTQDFFVTFSVFPSLIYERVMKMVKIREAKYCNLKLLLIFLVVYGHLIEWRIYESEVLMMQYRIIYFMHMPVFCFMTGMFLKAEKACKEMCVKSLVIYVVLQTLAVIFGQGKVTADTPYWHLWYLLSTGIWSGMAWMWYRWGKGIGKVPILISGIVIGCLAGMVTDIGREYSLSRTMVFFVYFWAGVIWNKREQTSRHWIGIIALVAAVALIVTTGYRIPVNFLYHATPYENNCDGILLRLLCYVIGFAFIILMIEVTPNKRFPFTKAGANTMPVYLFHVPFVIYIRKNEIGEGYEVLYALAIVYVIYMVSRLYDGLYGIVGRDEQVERVSKGLRRVRKTGI